MPKVYKRNCDHCGNYYEGGGKRYCSIACRTSCPAWQENLKKNPKRFKKGHVPWIKGRKHPNNANGIATLKNYVKENGPWNRGVKGSIPRNKTSFTSERVRGPNNVNWKGGIAGENATIRKSKQYQEWRMKVFQRDWFCCVMCGYRSKKPRDIRADHIKPFSLFPELRFDVDNGRTFCIPCDLKHGWNCLRDSNDNFNYAHNGSFYRFRVVFRQSIHQVLAPAGQ